MTLGVARIASPVPGEYSPGHIQSVEAAQIQTSPAIFHQGNLYVKADSRVLLCPVVVFDLSE